MSLDKAKRGAFRYLVEALVDSKYEEWRLTTPLYDANIPPFNERIKDADLVKMNIDHEDMVGGVMTFRYLTLCDIEKLNKAKIILTEAHEAIEHLSVRHMPALTKLISLIRSIDLDINQLENETTNLGEI
jgi:hypothetical protein